MLSLTIYKYKNTALLNGYIKDINNTNKKVMASVEMNNDFPKENEYEVDISSVIVAATRVNNTTFDYDIEQFILGLYRIYDIKFIVKEDIVDKVLDRFPLFFSNSEKLFDYDDNNNDMPVEPKTEKQVLKIKDYTDEQIEKLISDFNEKLIGHASFKNELAKHLKEFRLFSKIGEHKILSIFIFGTSGIGKTEVARILHKLIAPSEKMIKLSFGNYSSDGALNSLIGSPRGYIGSEDGELNTKLNKSLSSDILIDEFEKGAKSVSNFFLELLEEGKYTDMLGEEHDLNGYIIIFTSNIPEDKIAKEISPEFLNRLNCVCKFNFLNEDDKFKYLNLRCNDLVEKFNKVNDIKLDEEKKKLLLDINVSEYNSIREIENEIKTKFIDLVDEVEKND